MAGVSIRSFPLVNFYWAEACGKTISKINEARDAV
jgi:hypothetical protein